MPFAEFPPGPQLPPLLVRSASTAERPALPLHPLLQPMRSSRPYPEPTERADSPEEPSQHLSTQQLLNAERWAHHRTLIALRNEIARRDQLDQQIALLKQEFQAMGNEWSAATKTFVQCDAERLDLVREVQSLRSELEAWQFAYQDLSGVRTGNPQPLCLDMTTAKERQSTLRDRKATSHTFPLTTSNNAFERGPRTSSIYEEATVEPLFAQPKSAGV